MRIICARCDLELKPRPSTSGVDVLYVDESECPRCRRRSGGAKRPRGIGQVKIVRTGGYDPESKEKVVDPTLEPKP